jgi:hypothetical protein
MRSGMWRTHAGAGARRASGYAPRERVSRRPPAYPALDLYFFMRVAQHVKSLPSVSYWVGAVTMLMGATAWGLVLVMLVS